jgi:hypothetical protein
MNDAAVDSHPLVVWKYRTLIVPGGHPLPLPVGARVLSAGVQGDDVVVWALVDPQEMETRCQRVHVVGTGHPITTKDPGRLRFIQTVAYPGEEWFHVFVAE